MYSTYIPLSRLLLLPLLLAALLALHGCKDDPSDPPEPYDPCSELTPLAEADFQIFENVGDTIVESETVMAYRFATFKAVGVYDSVKWRIGQMDSLFTAKEVSLRFQDNAIGTIRVSMIGYRANTGCFPGDPEVVSLSKDFRVIKWGEAPIIGKYEGYFNGDTSKKDTVGIHFRIEEGYPEDYWQGEFDLTNIHPGCNLTAFDRGGDLEDPFRYDHEFGSRRYVFLSGNYPKRGYGVGNCDTPNATAWLQGGDDTLRVEYTYFEGVGDDASPLYRGEFTGVRIIE